MRTCQNGQISDYQFWRRVRGGGRLTGRYLGMHHGNGFAQYKGGNGRMILSKSQGEQEINGGNNGCVVRHVIWG